MQKVTGKPQILKKFNSSMIEQTIYEHGPLSKPELVKLTSLSLPTVGKLVNDLEKNKRLCRAGYTEKGAGRKAILYETNRNSGCLLVVYYYSGGQFRCRIVDMLNNTLYEEIFSVDTGSSEAATASTLKAIDSMMTRAPAKVKAIGVGLPGVVKPDGCLQSIPQFRCWEGFNLQRLLAARYKIAVCVENVTKLLVVGYYHTVLKDKKDNLVYIYIGNGICSGLIINKELYRGSIGSSGEIGFMISPGGRNQPRTYSVSSGYMETHLGKLVDYNRGVLRQGGTKARREEFVDIMCMIAANHVAILNPEVIVFGGPAFSDSLIDSVSRRMSRYIPAELMPQIVHDASDNTGIEGLILTCRSSITVEMHLVQNSGQIRRRAV
ncbi:MAG: ROK family transcriptional regulator [Treponema sp.]|jgi:predicted NBD/HSP70 family sugar kinase|nr:ROK family transcriptional regulator [Treponema sp.]